MKKHRTQIILFTLFIYFIIYLTSTILESQFWGNLLSPIGALLAFGIVFSTYYKSNFPKNIKFTWLFFSLSFLSWAIADILWAINTIVLDKDPTLNSLIAAFYIGTNIFLLAALIIYAFRNLKKFNAILLFLNSTFLSVLTLYLLWILFLNENQYSLKIISDDSWITTLTIILNVAAIIGATIWYYSLHNGKLPLYLHLTWLSTLLFFATDLFWYYLNITERYVPNSIIDSIFIIAFLGISVGAILRRNTTGKEKPHNIRYSKKSIKNTTIYLLCYLILIIVLKGFMLIEVFHFFLAIIVYISLSIYIISAIKEHNVNLELEKRINERTVELVKKNKLLDILSKQDSVTNLFNRRYFIQKLETEIVNTSPNKTLALLFIDLDRFKTINDIYGHDVGDLVLIEIAKRLQINKDKNSFLARFGGDEFIIAFHANYVIRKWKKLLNK